MINRDSLSIPVVKCQDGFKHCSCIIGRKQILLQVLHYNLINIIQLKI